MLLRFLLDTLPFLIGFFAIYPIMLFMPAAVFTHACAHAYLCLRLSPGSYSFRFGAENTWRDMRKRSGRAAFHCDTPSPY